MFLVTDACLGEIRVRERLLKFKKTIFSVEVGLYVLILGLIS